MCIYSVSPEDTSMWLRIHKYSWSNRVQCARSSEIEVPITTIKMTDGNIPKGTLLTKAEIKQMTTILK